MSTIPCFWRIVYHLNHILQLWGILLFVHAIIFLHFTLGQAPTKTVLFGFTINIYLGYFCTFYLFSMAENFSKSTKERSGPLCIIPDCCNRISNDRIFGIERSYFRVSSSSTQQFKEWMKHNRLHLGLNWKPRSNSRICSDHFIGGTFSI